MKELLLNNIQIVWFISVILSTFLLVTISKYTLSFIKRKWSRGAEFSSLFTRLAKINKVFLIVLCLGLLSYLFLDKETHSFMNRNIVRIIWIGTVSIITVISASISSHYFDKRMSLVSRRDKGDVTTYKYLNYLANFFIYLTGLILIALSIPGLKSIAAAAAGSAGVLALIAGVAAQEGIANLAGGLFIAFFKPFRIGDIIKIGDGIMGKVEDLNLRHTTINNFQNKRIIIPNAIINKENITNYYLGEYKMCEWIEVGISYDSDIDSAMEIIRQECESHKYCIDNRTEQEKSKNIPKVDVQVIGLGDSSVNLKAWVWCASYLTGFKMRNDLYRSIKQRFDKEGVEIPFPHTTVVFKGKKALETIES